MWEGYLWRMRVAMKVYLVSWDEIMYAVGRIIYEDKQVIKIIPYWGEEHMA